MNAEKLITPTVPPPQPEGLNPALHRNITTLKERHRREEASASVESRLAAAVTAFTGSMLFVYVHLVILLVWVSVNVGLISVLPRFDRTFVILATATSVEAIFLSTFVLISQNRATKAADRRADLDLQINLLAEHEVTHLITVVVAIADKLGVAQGKDPALKELEQDVAPEVVLDTLDGAEKE